MNEINILLPSSLMNCTITKNNYFVADTNNSKNFQQLKIQLPQGKWSIRSYKYNNILLHRKLNSLQIMFGRYYLGILFLVAVGYAFYKFLFSL